jgi:hypothetical protein
MRLYTVFVLLTNPRDQFLLHNNVHDYTRSRFYYHQQIQFARYRVTGLEKISQWFSQEKKNGFRTMCTVDENKAAALRIVVNRKVDEVHKTIYFHRQSF